MRGMVVEAVAGAGIVAGAMGWAVRGKSSRVFGPSIWRGPKTRKAMALTFDDGPSESTRELLDLLDEHGVKATFFQCGFNVRRLWTEAAEVGRRGHEIGNHTDTHPALYFQSKGFIEDQLTRAQRSIEEYAGAQAKVFRAPFGARWFGLQQAQEKLGLMGAMWSTIARDWVLPAQGVEQRLREGAKPGAILCLHDGRALEMRPDVSPMMDAMRKLLPEWVAEGWEFVTVSEMAGGRGAQES